MRDPDSIPRRYLCETGVLLLALSRYSIMIIIHWYESSHIFVSGYSSLSLSLSLQTESHFMRRLSAPFSLIFYRLGAISTIDTARHTEKEGMGVRGIDTENE
jgi:hypothetical protein